ncbi:MAG: citrate synthase [Oleiphilaceae bacterium]|jgi:citrate synthase
MNNKGMSKRQVYHSSFWEEVAEDDNPFATKEAYCHGYNVYEDILQKATWFEYLYVMFKGEKPTEAQAKLLEKLAIALANPGPREASVRAAMNGGVGGSTHAASLMAALAVGAGQYGGSHEVFLVVQLWSKCGFDIDKWKLKLSNPNEDPRADIWHPIEHGPGFDPNGINCPSTTLNILNILESVMPGGALTWLKENRTLLEQYLGYPLAISGIAAAAFYDLELNEDQASMLYLTFRLPGAAAHALEQSSVPWNKFPFFGDAIELLDDPGPKGVPNFEELLK